MKLPWARAVTQHHQPLELYDGVLMEQLLKDTKEARLWWRRRHAVRSDWMAQFYCTYNGRHVTFTRVGSNYRVGIMLDDGRELSVKPDPRLARKLLGVLTGLRDEGELLYHEHPVLLPPL